MQVFYLARPEGLEPATFRFVAERSIQLSYERTPLQVIYYHIQQTKSSDLRLKIDKSIDFVVPL